MNPDSVAPLDAEAARLAEVYRQADAIRKAADARHYSWWWHLKWWFWMTKWGVRLTNWELRRYEDEQTRQWRLRELARALLADGKAPEGHGDG